MDQLDNIFMELDKLKTSTNELARIIDGMYGSFNVFYEAVQNSLLVLDRRVSRLESK